MRQQVGRGGGGRVIILSLLNDYWTQLNRSCTLGCVTCTKPASLQAVRFLTKKRGLYYPAMLKNGVSWWILIRLGPICYTGLNLYTSIEWTPIIICHCIKSNTSTLLQERCVRCCECKYKRDQTAIELISVVAKCGCSLCWGDCNRVFGEFSNQSIVHPCGLWSLLLLDCSLPFVLGITEVPMQKGKHTSN